MMIVITSSSCNVYLLLTILLWCSISSCINAVSPTIELDERMTQETKNYVLNFMQSFGPLQLILPFAEQNQILDNYLTEVNSKVSFDIIEEDLFITNIIDNYQIPINECL